MREHDLFRQFVRWRDISTQIDQVIGKVFYGLLDLNERITQNVQVDGMIFMNCLIWMRELQKHIRIMVRF